MSFLESGKCLEENKQIPNLSVGMMVEVTFQDETLYGIVKFLGDVFVKDRLHNIVGVELVCLIILIFSTYTVFFNKEFVFKKQ